MVEIRSIEIENITRTRILMKKKMKNKNTFSFILVVVLVVVMALISFQLRENMGFEPEPISDEISPNLVFSIGPLQVTSTVVNTWIMMVFLSIGAYFIGK